MNRQNDCVAQVAALITENDIGDFDAIIQKEPPYNEADFYFYLAIYGHACGLTIENPRLVGGMITFAFQMQDHKCAVVIRKSNGKTHMLYWDGKMMIDPDDKAPDGLQLSDYDVERIIPVREVEKYD